MKVVRVVKKYFLPIPDMVCQSSSDCRSAFLLPFALAERQTHMWPDEIIEDLKESLWNRQPNRSNLPLFLQFLRFCSKNLFTALSA
jgi:hypothetical protein